MNTDGRRGEAWVRPSPAVSETDRIRAFFDAAAPERDRWRRRNRTYNRELDRYCRSVIPEGASVLEIGCGTGDLLAALRPCRGVGIDISEAMVARARRKYPGLEFRIGDAADLPEGETFDWVVMSDLLGFLPDVQQALQALWRAVRPDSRVVITHYNPLWGPVLKAAEAAGLKMREPLQNWLSGRDMENLLYLTGFEVVGREMRLLCPVVLPVLSAFLNRFLARVPGIRRLCLIQALVARPAGVSRDASTLTCSVIVPCRNERGTVEQAVLQTPEMGAHTELIFVVGDSSDGTAEEVERCMAAYPGRDVRLIRQASTGKGGAVREGFDAAWGDVLMILDGDLTVAPGDLPKFFEALASGRGELAVGSRLVYPMDREAMRFLNMLGNRFFGVALSVLIGQRVEDTLCGTKALFASDYRKTARLRDALGSPDPFGDFDLIFGAARLSRKIVEIPVRYRRRTYGRTQIRRFRHGWRLLRMCWMAMRKLAFT